MRRFFEIEVETATGDVTSAVINVDKIFAVYIVDASDKAKDDTNKYQVYFDSGASGTVNTPLMSKNRAHRIKNSYVLDFEEYPEDFRGCNL